MSFTTPITRTEIRSVADKIFCKHDYLFDIVGDAMTWDEDTKRRRVRRGPRVSDAGHSLTRSISYRLRGNRKRGNKDDHQGH